MGCRPVLGMVAIGQGVRRTVHSIWAKPLQRAAWRAEAMCETQQEEPPRLTITPRLYPERPPNTQPGQERHLWRGRSART